MNQLGMRPEEVRAEISKYRWYHEIEVLPSLITPSACPHFKNMWDFNLNCLKAVDFRNKRVLDIGCRDGLFSLHAERAGAREVVGIDNDLSPGLANFLIPFFRSRIHLAELNLYQLDPGREGRFDVILWFGVLYHLRYPFHGIRKVLDCITPGGVLALETATLSTPHLAEQELLYCPVEGSPYDEPTSCTFFNRKALTTTLDSLGFVLEKAATFRPGLQAGVEPFASPPVSRGMRAAWRNLRARFRPLRMEVAREFLIFRKASQDSLPDYRMKNGRTFTRPWAEGYWDATHREHTGEKK